MIDVALWATVPPTGPLDQVQALVDAGAAAFKCSTFNTHPQRFPQIPDPQLLRAFGRSPAPAEWSGSTPRTTSWSAPASPPSRRRATRGDPLAHARSRPPIAENEAIARVLEMARVTGVRIHICHVTTPRGVQLIAQARADGVDATGETCPHYLLLDESDLARRGGECKINPPLRSDTLPADGLELISSDHVGWPIERKHGPDIFALASGAPGVELIAALVHDALGPAELVRLVSEHPAKRFGLWPRKGALAPGFDADVMVLDESTALDRSTRPRWSRPPAGARTRAAPCAGAWSRPSAAASWSGTASGCSPDPDADGSCPPTPPPSVSETAAALRCRGWRQETILRLLENNLAIAEDPRQPRRLRRPRQGRS